mgnify:CR=1 FL=1
MEDYLSQLEYREVGDGVRNEFLDAELFKVTMKTTMDATVADEDKWLTGIHQFLSTGLPPKELNRDEQKCLALKGRHLCLIHDTLYHKRADGIWQRAVRSDLKRGPLRSCRWTL